MNNFFNAKIKSKVSALLAFATLFLLTSCYYHRTPEENANLWERDPIDREADLNRRDWREIVRPQTTLAKLDAKNGGLGEDPGEDYGEDGGTIPPIADALLNLDAPDIDSEKRVSLTVDESVELRDVLLELARLAELELALDPSIAGGVILTVKNRPVGEVMEMVADLANLQYSVEDGILRVSKDAPYLVNYHVDYLNVVRNTSGSMDVSTTSGSGGGGGGGGGDSGGDGGESGGSSFSSASSFTAGSSTSITTESTGDLWGSVEANITSILDSSGGGSGEAGDQGDGSKITVNKQAGVITVYTTQKKHKSIKRYLDMVMDNTSAQVLIEAKVLEVELNDSYATGIDWSLARGKFNISNSQGLALDSLSNTFLTNTVFSGLVSLPRVGRELTNSKTILTFLEGFGTTRALSNPRITIQNNQQAVLSFARNETFFTIEVTPSSTTSTGTSSTSSDTAISSSLNTVPIGVVLALQPSINVDTQEVTMHIRPTLTSKVGDVQDPAVRLNAISLAASSTTSDLADEVSNLNSPIPVIQVRELDTVLKAKSGEVMVIGGLLQHKDLNADVGLPFFSEIPVLGNFAKKTEKTANVVETVILMTAKIIPPRDNYHEHDKHLYKSLTQDPRPLNF